MALQDIKTVIDEIVADMRAGRVSPPASVPKFDPARISAVDLARIDALMTRDGAVQEAVDAEPQVLHLLKIAVLSSDEPRWHRYELLKNLGSSLVGWDARADVLRTTRHYDHFVRAIDTLLSEDPTIEEEMEA